MAVHTPRSNRSALAVTLVLFIFLCVSMITAVMGPIFPALKSDFNISNTVTALFPFTFYMAYAVVSIPAGLMTERFGQKKMLLSAFAFAATGSLVVISFPRLAVVLIALFGIGCAMAMLQVVINPLLRAAGGEEHYSFFAVMGQLVFALGGMLSPQLYSLFVTALEYREQPGLVLTLLNAWVPESMSWVSMYCLFLVMCLLLLIAVWVVRLPRVGLTADQRIGRLSLCLGLLKNKTVVLFMLGIMAYIGSEVGITTSMSLFLQTYHGADPATVGADAISSFWLAMGVGCFIGLGLMKLFDARKVLMLFAGCAMLAYTVALWTPLTVALWAFKLTGFFLSVMFPAIFSLGLNSIDRHHGSVAGIFCSGIAGGALVPLMVGAIADISSEQRYGALFVLFPLAYIFSIGIWAKPLINNKTISIRRDIPVA